MTDCAVDRCEQRGANTEIWRVGSLAVIVHLCDRHHRQSLGDELAAIDAVTEGADQ